MLVELKFQEAAMKKQTVTKTGQQVHQMTGSPCTVAFLEMN